MSVAGAVLAAGASLRMGSSKALLRFGPATFLENLIRSLEQGGCDPVLSVVAEPVDPIRSACDLGPARLVVNPAPERGQISSLVCALDAIPEADGLLLVLVDQADVRAESVAAVLAALPGNGAAVARFGGRAGHPTAWSRSCFPELRGRRAAEHGARVVTDSLAAMDRITWVDLADAGVVRNLNTPQDLERALALRAKDPR